MATIATERRRAQAGHDGEAAGPFTETGDARVAAFTAVAIITLFTAAVIVVAWMLTFPPARLL